MVIGSPQLISCSAKVDDVQVIRASGLGAFIFVFKNHTGSPLHEVEVFTVADAQAALSGPNFFNINPAKIQILTESFNLVTAILLTSAADIDAGADPIVRFYWNYAAGRALNTILYADYDIITKTLTGPILQTSFGGIDPFVLDARVGSDPDRLYMFYITPDNNMTVRISHDLGVTWSSHCDTCCLFASDVFYDEALLLDDATTRNQIRAVLRDRSPGSTPDVFLVDVSLEPITTTQTSTVSRAKKLYPFFRRPTVINAQGQDAQRFKLMYPLVRRGEVTGTTTVISVEDPC